MSTYKWRFVSMSCAGLVVLILLILYADFNPYITGALRSSVRDVTKSLNVFNGLSSEKDDPPIEKGLAFQDMCSRLDGKNEWLQYIHWLNKVLNLTTNSNLSSTLEQLHLLPLQRQIVHQSQSLQHYKFAFRYEEHQQFNVYHIHLKIFELFEGIPL